MAKRTSVLISTLLLVFIAPEASVAQQQHKPLTNDDVIAMVHKKLPESVIV
jgi:hypothetical protein